MAATFTFENWLAGMVDYNVPDNTLYAILFNRGVEVGSDASASTQKQRDLCLADMYMWLATSSSTTTGEYVSDGGWQHQKSAKSVVDRAGLRALAKALYDKWNESDVVTSGGITMKDLY